jgi:MFS family permease
MVQLKATQKEPEYKKVKRSLRYSILDGSFYNIMDGFTLSFITPYALFLNASNIIISLLASVPDLVASFFQLTAIKANEIFRSRKLLIVVSAFLQALLWIPILLIPRFAKPENQGIYLIVFVTMAAMLYSFIAPLWRGMMGDLVSEHERGGFFSKRNKIVAIVSFLSTLAAGGLLQYFSAIHPLAAFTILFTVAFVARSLSAVFIALMYEKKAAPSSSSPFGSHSAAFRRKNNYTLFKFLKELNKSDFGHFVLFICLFRIAVSVASPFFAVYELKYLGYSYLQFTALSATEIVASVLFLGLWGKINDEKGSRFVILICGLLIPFVPLLYLFSPNFYYLIGVSVISGAAWGGFNLAVGNYLFDASSSENRVRYVAYFNLLHGISIFIGAMVGGFLLQVFPASKASVLTLFALSGGLRLLVAAAFFPRLHEQRVVQVRFDKKFYNYSIFIKPRQGFLQDQWEYYMAYEKKPANTPRLKIDPVLYSEPEFVDLEEKRKKDKLIQKNFMQSMFDNMKKK